MAGWVGSEYRKGEIDRAGDELVVWWTTPEAETTEEIGHAFHVAQNWRACHAFPLNTFQILLRQRARRVESDAIVAQRLKRASSMMNKLAREPRMKLSQMQDLGGCRAIMSSIDSVYKLFNSYRGGSDTLFEPQVKCYDYIRKPKPDGYRGIHVIGRYFAKIETRKPWNGQRIEIQLRSKLQHSFATAVEIVTTFTGTPLKFGGGQAEWRRFFSLMGSAIARRENTALVEGTPTDNRELVDELKKATKALKVRQRLRGWAQALKTLPRQNIQSYKWLLLVLDVAKNTVKVTGYIDRKAASDAVNQIEQSKKADQPPDAVLVWVKSIKELRLAYPNYYADTTEFLEVLDTALKN